MEQIIPPPATRECEKKPFVQSVMREKKRPLDLSVTIRDDGSLELSVREPESGESYQFDALYSPDEHPEFDAKLGNEIYSWISLWYDCLTDSDD